MEIMTASYFNYFGPGRVGISMGTPKIKGIKKFYPLAPSRTILKIKKFEIYTRMYREGILGRLDPQETVDKMAELVEGDLIVMQCYERPPLTRENFCHRRMVAEWLEGALGIEVPEFVPPQQIKPNRNPDDLFGGL